MEEKIEMTEDIEYFLSKAKNSIDIAIEQKDPMLCLSHIRQAEISIRAHLNLLQTRNEQLSA
jgi:hypothetical protein